MQHEVVAPARDRERIELDRAEPAEHLEHRLRPALERACRCEQLALDEEPTRGLGRDLHVGTLSGEGYLPALRCTVDVAEAEWQTTSHPDAKAVTVASPGSRRLWPVTVADQLVAGATQSTGAR